MLIAHLPAGYIAGSALSGILGRRVLAPRRRLMTTLLVASVLPDFDLFWFYLVDHRQHVHHTYWTHMPIFWLLRCGLAASISVALRRASMLPYVGAVATGTLLHLVLDTVAGGIYWLHPFSALEFRWVDVPAVHGWWVLNFVLHRSFAIELILLVVSLGVRRASIARSAAPLRDSRAWHR